MPAVYVFQGVIFVKKSFKGAKPWAFSISQPGDEKIAPENHDDWKTIRLPFGAWRIFRGYAAMHVKLPGSISTCLVSKPCWMRWAKGRVNWMITFSLVFMTSLLVAKKGEGWATIHLPWFFPPPAVPKTHQTRLAQDASRLQLRIPPWELVWAWAWWWVELPFLIATPSPKKVAFWKGNPLISGKSSWVKYYNLARSMVCMFALCFILPQIQWFRPTKCWKGWSLIPTLTIIWSNYIEKFLLYSFTIFPAFGLEFRHHYVKPIRHEHHELLVDPRILWLTSCTLSGYLTRQDLPGRLFELMMLKKR